MRFLFLLCWITVFSITSVYADQFGEFKNQFSDDRFLGDVNSEFDAYQKQLNKDFKVYKDTVESEFKTYSQLIQKRWRESVVSDDVKWVEYSKQFNKRRIVDFEKSTIQIDIQLDSSESNQKMIKMVKEELSDLIQETRRQAWDRDIFARRVESVVKANTKTYLAENISNTPIIQDRFFIGTPSQGQVDKKVLSLLKLGEIKLLKSEKGPNVLSMTVKLPETDTQRKVASIKAYVDNYAIQQRISTQLIYTVIHHESRFNPLARSHVPAFGLMQIVPRSAGMDATRYLFGKSKLLLPSYLYNSKNNIQIGTAYLHILYYRYLSAIKDKKSRLYCAIAAYNTGAGNVAKAFTGHTSIKKAATIINRMSPSQVYRTLEMKLPYKETRRYLKKITTTMPIYKSI